LSFQNQWAPVFQAANVIQWAYVPPLNPMPINAWPTLGEMITNNQRLVIFIDYVGKDGTLVNYLIPEFQTVSLFRSLPRLVNLQRHMPGCD
jgi:hypothetical protein